MAAQLRELLPSDWPAVERIYAEGIATGQATFEHDPPDWDRFDSSHTQDCRLALVEESTLAGWAALSPFSGRPVYCGVAEMSVYVAASARGRGLGSKLMAALCEASEQAGYWTLLAKIFPENEPSLRLAKRHGFRQIGRLERIGQHHGVWRDVILLERRATQP